MSQNDSQRPQPEQPEAPEASRKPEMLATDRESRQSPDVLPIHQQVIREMADPQDGIAPTPVWLMLFYFGLLMWGGYYLAQNSGDFRVDIYNEDPSALYGGDAASAAPKPVDLMTVGKRTYNNCTQCHQPDGKGVSGAFPPLDGSERVSGPPHVLAALLLHGLEGEALVLGEKYNAQMPAWNQLSDTEIAGVLTYIRSSWSNQYEAVPPELVTAMRAATSSQPGAYSDSALDELAQTPPPVANSPDTGAATAAPPPSGGL